MAAPQQIAIVRIFDASGIRFQSVGAALVQNGDSFTLKAGTVTDTLESHWSPGLTFEVILRNERGKSQRWTCTEPKFADDGSLTLDGKKVAA